MNFSLKLLSSFLILMLFFISKNRAITLEIENIFPDRGPISGGTRIVIFLKNQTKINYRKFPNPKVLLYIFIEILYLKILFLFMIMIFYFLFLFIFIKYF